MVMGDVGTSALEQLKGYKVKQIKETDPAIFAKDVDRVCRYNRKLPK